MKLNKCDEVAAIAVGGHPLGDPDDRDRGIRVIQPFTTDHALAVSRIPQQIPYGQTPLYDGINRGLEVIESSHYPNREMIVVTDGLDNTSRTESDEVIARAKKDGVAIYAIGLGDLNARQEQGSISMRSFVLGNDDPDGMNEKALEALSAPSTGRYFVGSELAQDKGKGFVAAVEQVANTIGNGYSIGVIAPSWAGQTITIGLANPGALRVTSRMESTSTAAPQ